MKSNISDIVSTIYQERCRSIAAEGPSLGCSVPSTRQVPLTSVDSILQEPVMICEIKRSSPSKGIIADRLDPVTQAGIYHRQGIKIVSVLTEERYFHGSLNDLIKVKQTYPDLAALRKDFLSSKQDIDISYRAGADLVLLIASLLSKEELFNLYYHILSYGMTPLVEVHSADDIKRVRHLAPILTGINCRDLKTFTVDRLYPVKQKQLIDWPTKLVYESGIREAEDACFAGRQGFHAILVGESVVRDPSRIPLIRKGFKEGRAFDEASDFWTKLMQRRTYGRPLVKICGITNHKDAETATSLGADVLGFIFAPSPREVNAAFVETLEDLQVIKVAVVVDAGGDNSRYLEAKRLLDSGIIDALQLHGNEQPDVCRPLGYPYYKALRIRHEEDVSAIERYRPPRVLIDAYHPRKQGGTGRRIDENIVYAAMKIQPVWIAGGITAENVGEMVRKFKPELIDVSSGIEYAPGRKDTIKMKRLFRSLENCHEYE